MTVVALEIRRLTYAEDGAHYPDEITVSAPAGSLLIYNAGLWHGGGPKTCAGTRWAFIPGYGRWFIKPSWDYSKNTPRHIWDAMTDAQKDLLGFRCVPPKDEFTRLRRRSDAFEEPEPYSLP